MSGDIDDFRGLLAKVGNGETLGIDEAERALKALAGTIPTAERAALRDRLEEIRKELEKEKAA